MLPTIGDVVLYHFSHVHGRLPGGLRNVVTFTRPAIVISDPDDDGRVRLQPFYGFLDDPTPDHTGVAGPTVIPVPPHRDPGGEVGVIGTASPKPSTWSWRPIRRGTGEVTAE
jgi:hypothetical protein